MMTAVSFQLPAASFQLQIPKSLVEEQSKSWELGAGSWQLTRHSYSSERNNLRRGIASVRNLQDELSHVPRVGRAALGAQSAVQADIFVLQHDAAGLLERLGGIQRLVQVDGRGVEPLAKKRLVAVHADCQAVHRA